MNNEKKRLVILTTHFGSNFSGGSRATIEIFSRIQDHFEEVVAIGTELGKHDFRSFRFLRYSGWLSAVRIIKKFDRNDSIFYGDFYNAFLFILAGRPFFFTYHDNWHYLAKNGMVNFVKGIFYTNVYALIIKRSLHAFTVSRFNWNYTSRHTEKTSIVYNGYRKNVSKKILPCNPGSIVMVGNIDSRKYRMAVRLFSIFPKEYAIQVDIYGHIKDANIASQLDQFTFVNLKGYVEQVPLGSYNCMSHTSMVESFGMIFCEAITHHIPVIAFDAGGAREILSGDNSVLVPPYSINEMKEACIAVLDGKRMFAFESADLKEFDWDKAAKQYQGQML